MKKLKYNNLELLDKKTINNKILNDTKTILKHKKHNFYENSID